jgi:hypothetical protein
VPSEFLEDDSSAATMPRRLGLSEVVTRQIDQYRERVRRRDRMSDQEVADLIRLVVRRPDAAQVFLYAGRRLSAVVGQGVIPTASLPRNLAFRLARRSASRSLKKIFGRDVGGFAHGPFALEGRGLIFSETDGSGQACHVLTGFLQGVVTRRVGAEYQVVHAQCQCQTVGDPLCRWTVTGEARLRERDGVREMLLRPELEAG